jgi:hypothetical protein
MKFETSMAAIHRPAENASTFLDRISGTSRICRTVIGAGSKLALLTPARRRAVRPM